MFRIKLSGCNWLIVDGKENHLHSDGMVYHMCPEYFPTGEAAQRVLDKFYPKPLHVWEHGDVFKNYAGTQIYLKPCGGPIVVNLEHTNSGGTPEVQLEGNDVKFLFNIKEKL